MKKWAKLLVAIGLLLLNLTGCTFFSKGKDESKIISLQCNGTYNGYSVQYKMYTEHDNFYIKVSFPVRYGVYQKVLLGNIPKNAWNTLKDTYFSKGNTVERKGNVVATTKMKSFNLSLPSKDFHSLTTHLCSLADKYANKTYIPELVENREIVRIAKNLSKNTHLGLASSKNILFYNKIGGELIAFIPSKNCEYELGNVKFLQTNFEGLGLVVVLGDDLYFWEKKMLQNKMILLCKNWAKRSKNEVFIRGGNVFYISPSSKGDVLSCYDYIHRERYTLGKVRKEERIADVSEDGKFILLKSPQGFYLLKRNGKMLKRRHLLALKGDLFFLNAPKTFVLFQGNDTFQIVHIRGENFVSKTMYVKKKTLLKFMGLYCHRRYLAYRDERHHICFLYDLGKKKKIRINKTPMNVERIVVTNNGEVYFTCAGDLFLCRTLKKRPFWVLNWLRQHTINLLVVPLQLFYTGKTQTQFPLVGNNLSTISYF